MTEPFAFDAELREALAAGPRVAPAMVVDRAFEVARGRTQRRPRFAWLDRRAWPAPRASIADPGMARSVRLVLILALLAAAVAAIAIGAALREDDAPWRLEDAGSLLSIKYDPIPVALPDGRLLIGGSGSGDGRLFEVFDPALGQSILIGDVESDALQSATLLPDGRVLLIVWHNAEPVSDGQSYARLFDPSRNSLGRPIEMVEDRLGPGVSAMADGRVLVTGGSTDPESGLVRDTVEIFDPASSAFVPGGRLPEGRSGHSQITLPDGKLMISGGSVSVPRLVPGATGPALIDGSGSRPTDGVLWDPATGTTTAVPKLPSVPSFRAADPVALADGRILLFGPETTRCGQHGNLPSEAFLLDPATATLVQAPDVPHTPDTAVALPDGRVLLAGQWQATPGGCAEGRTSILHGWVAVYDPATAAVIQTPDPFTGAGGLPFEANRNYRASVMLPDGRVALIDEDFEAATPNAIQIVDPPR